MKSLLLFLGRWVPIVLLLVGCGEQASESTGAKAAAVTQGEAGATQHYSVELQLPKGRTLRNVILGASAALKIEDGVIVDSEAGDLGWVLNSGSGLLELGADSRLGTTAAPVSAAGWGNGFLRERAAVSGSLSVAGTVSRQNGTSVTGGVTEDRRESLQPARIQVEFPQGGVAVHLEPDQHRTLDPGTFGTLSVKPRARLTLRAGTYFVDDLDFHSESILRIEDSTEPVIVYSKGALDFRARIEGHEATRRFLLVGLSDAPWNIDAPFRGTVFAPQAHLRLSPVNGQGHDGAFFGKTLEVGARNPIRHVPFAFWDQVLPDPTSEPASSYVDLAILLPRGVSLRDVRAGARRDLTIESQGSIVAGQGLATSALGLVTLSSQASSGGLVAPRVTVGSGASVNGDIRSEGAPMVAPTAVISGSVQPDQVLSPPVAIQVSSVFPPASDGDRLVRTGRSSALLPGDFGSVRVEGGATLSVRSGIYRIRSLVLESGSTLVIEGTQGPVQLQILEALTLLGNVRGSAHSTVSLLTLFGGNSAVAVGGTYRGALIAPAAEVRLENGTHAGFMYGDSLQIFAGSSLSAGSDDWIDILVDDRPVTSTVQNRGEALLASSTREPVRYTDPSGFDFRVRERLPVQAGNAGNHSTLIHLTGSFGTVSCSYRGGATVAHPTSQLELALGREYRFEGCTDGSVPGDVLFVQTVEVEVSGDPEALGGETRVQLGAGETCDDVLPPPLSPGESRQLIDSFAWPSLSSPVNGELLAPWMLQGRIMERTVDGKPALYYAQIYLQNQRERDYLDQFLIHWMKRPLLFDDWPKDWENSCGTIKYDHDGEGMWVWAVLPGVTYNAIREARFNENIEESKRETFKAIRLLMPPPAMRTEWGSLKLTALAETGFQYLGIRELPSDEAIDDILYRAGVVDALVDIVEFVVDAARDLVRESVVFFGTFDSIYGTVRVTFDTNALHKDRLFERRDPSGNTIPMLSAWRSSGRTELSPEGDQVTLYNWVQRVITLGIPSPVSFRTYLGGAGRFALDVSKDDDTGNVAFRQVCYELQNAAGTVTSWLIADEFCDGIHGDKNFKGFREATHQVVDYDDRHFVMHAELTDSFEYLHQIVGQKAKPARVLSGLNAYVLAGLSDRTYAACFGYGDLVADLAVFGLAPVVPLAAIYLATLATSDIVVPGGSTVHASRGVLAHEYGHYALCDLVRVEGDEPGAEGTISDVVLTFDTIGAGSNPDPGDDARVINEAFADFFSAQISGSTNYYNPNEIMSGGLRVRRGAPPAGLSLPVSAVAHTGGGNYVIVGPSGMDENVSHEEVALLFVPPNDRNPPGNFALARLATLMQDVFDGHEYSRGKPTDAEFWQLHPTSGLIGARTGPRYGDTDLERVHLGGRQILKLVQNFASKRNTIGAYREDALEAGIGKTLTDAVNWCRACEVMAPHFRKFSQVPTGTEIRSILEECESNQALVAALGPPPGGHAARELDAYTCEPCPEGQGMDESGQCTLCSVDQTIDWDQFSEDCRTLYFAEVDHPADNCPDTWILEVTNAAGEFPLQAVGQLVQGSLPTLECIGTTLRGEITTFNGASSSTTPFDLRGSPGCEVPLHEMPTFPQIPGHCYFRDGTIRPCTDSLCNGDMCEWGDTGAVRYTPVNADRVRITTEIIEGVFSSVRRFGEVQLIRSAGCGGEVVK